MKKLAQILAFTALCLQYSAFGAVETYTERLEGSSWSSLDVYDNKYLDMTLNANWQNEYTNYDVSNFVQLGINPDVVQTTTYLSGTIDIDVQYEYWDNTSSSFLWSSVESRTLTVSYDYANHTALIDDQSTFVFGDGHHIRVTVTGTSGIDLSNVYLEAGIEVQRYYTFDGNAVTNPGRVLSGVNNDYIRFHWDHKLGAEYYELEWVHINDYTIDQGQYVAINQLNYNYYLNSTRVSLKNNFYEIPLVYDHGYLIFRVRPVGKQGANFEFNYFGDWSAGESGLVSTHPALQVYHVTSEFDTDMNWSHSVGYTDEGRRAEGLSYVDGLGRGRQTIARNTETEQVIISNIYYDELGRPTVSDLPTPVNSEELKHRPDFNKAQTTGTPSFNKDYFDATAGDLCTPPQTMPFSNTSGAGQYYSSSNQNNDEENAYIPDAEGYPYTRVYYRNDFTGRLDRVSVAGDQLRLGAGHETRYIYVSPDEHELNSMFGTEVGDYTHYTKMITVDQNGQAYVQYTDLVGRVVASYMTGPSPANLDALSESIGAIETMPLIDDPQESDPDASIPSTTFEQTVFLPYDNETYVFDYAFTPQAYTSTCLSGSICFDCMYDLELSVIDECGTVYWQSTEVINGANFDEACNAQSELTYSETVENMPSGVYTIRKKLKVSQSAIDEYWCSYADNEICTSPISNYFNDYYSEEEFLSCDPENVYEYELQGYCDGYRSIMLSDVSPGGQYATFTVVNGVVTTNDPTSIFYGTTPYYTTVTFLDENSQAIEIENGAGQMVGPDELSTTEFVELFDPSWAPSLLPHHPEYCYLEFCESNSASHAYNESMNDTYSFSDAILSGNAFIAPLGLGTTVKPFDQSATNNKDPFFGTGGLGASEYTNMKNKMASYITIGSTTYSIWQWAIVQAMCPDAETETEVNTCLSNYDDKDPCTHDLIWVAFRSLYLELKMSFYYQIQQTYAENEGCDNACIGSADAGCEDYANKVSRFGNIETLFGSDLVANPNNVQTLFNSNSATYCNDLCEQYADDWIVELDGCDFSSNLTPAQITAMRADFIELCSFGCDGEHPTGATTTPTGQTTSGGHASIDDILEAYLGIGYETEACTELLVSAPGPYQADLFNSEVLTNPLDECGCDAIFQAEYDLANNNPNGLTYIEEMLAYNTGLSLDDINSLLCVCKSATEDWTPGYIWTTTELNVLATANVSVPMVLSCTSEECTISCDDIISDLEYLDTRFSGITNFTSTMEYKAIVENYLNDKYNYNLSYTDYINFASGCAATEQNPYCEISDYAEELPEVLNLLVHRGQLLNTSSNPVSLLSENIVYNQSDIKNLFASDSYYSAINGNILKLFFNNGGCDIDLTGWTGIDFDNIISIDGIAADGGDCSSAKNFKLFVTYLDCGQLTQRELSGVSNCFEIKNCYCGDNGQLLCDDIDLLDAAPCYEPYLSEMYQNAEEDFIVGLESMYTAFVEDFNDQCDDAFNTEKFSYTGRLGNYQYTLFFYDQGGNLIKTVAPGGYDDLFAGTTSNAAINAAREGVTGSASTGEIIPDYDYETTYEYNSYNQLVKTTNPDQEGNTEFWYDIYGRIRLSHNPVQADLNTYSYTKYDVYGRSIEVGQVQRTGGAPISYLEADDFGAAVDSWINGGTLTEVTITTYDESLSTTIANKFKSGTQMNLRLRVSSIAYFPIMNGGIDPTEDYESATHYSYDIHGNVIESLQDVPMMQPVDQDIKSTQYEFELISGNVQEVLYQEGELDFFKHLYCYDKLNRLTEVATTTDNIHITKEAHYEFYDYGPLARTEIGKNEVQGFDYNYTINGWVKGMNSSVLDTDYDMGRDGVEGYSAVNNDIHSSFAKDVAAWTIGYFADDYTSIGGVNMEATVTGQFDTYAPDLYNGNIRHTATSIYNMNTLGGAYSYDQLNRLTEMTAFENTSGANTWNGIGPTNEYYNAYSYDRNGNMLTLDRNATSSGLQMDQFTYNYTTVQGELSNRLSYVDDTALNDGVANDISANQPDENDPNGPNYQYDKLGQLVYDAQENISSMIWRKGDKKLQRIERNDLSSSQIDFVYNPFGMRVLKIEKSRSGGVIDPQSDWVYTYYTYDANSQVIGTYNIAMGSEGNFANWSEANIYGVSRVGQLQTDKTVYYESSPPVQGDIYQNQVGDRRYEVTNHLGNVLATVTDRSIWNSTDGLYEAVVVMTSDYYPFGMQMPGRQNANISSPEGYRYAFNGMEKDDEISGSGNSYTAEFWQYDSRLGRRWNVDPIVKHHESSYAAFANNPIIFIDPNGADTVSAMGIDMWRVEQGDSWWRIMEKTGVDWKKLQELNPDFKDKTLHPGDMLNLENTDKQREQFIDETGTYIEGLIKEGVQYMQNLKQTIEDNKTPEQKLEEQIEGALNDFEDWIKSQTERGGPLAFKAGEKANFRIVFKEPASIDIGNASISYSWVTISGNNEKIESSGMGGGFGADVSIFKTIHSSEIIFVQDMKGANLLDLFSQTKKIAVTEEGGVPGVVGLIKGYDGAGNVLWKARAKGTKLGAGGSHGTGPAKFERVY